MDRIKDTALVWKLKYIGALWPVLLLLRLPVRPLVDVVDDVRVVLLRLLEPNRLVGMIRTAWKKWSLMTRKFHLHKKKISKNQGFNKNQNFSNF